MLSVEISKCTKFKIVTRNSSEVFILPDDRKTYSTYGTMIFYDETLIPAIYSCGCMGVNDWNIPNGGWREGDLKDLILQIKRDKKCNNVSFFWNDIFRFEEITRETGVDINYIHHIEKSSCDLKAVRNRGWFYISSISFKKDEDITFVVTKQELLRQIISRAREVGIIDCRGNIRVWYFDFFRNILCPSWEPWDFFVRFQGVIEYLRRKDPLIFSAGTNDDIIYAKTKEFDNLLPK